MKRSFFALFLLLVLVLSACNREPTSSVYTAEVNGLKFIVDPSVGTIQCNGETYRLSVDIVGPGRETTITYPDGSKYFWTEAGNGSYGGWSNDYDPDRYIAGEVLLSAWDYTRPATRERSGNPAVGILCVILGLVNLIFPKLVWFLKHGWAFRDAEPSTVALKFIRISGAVVSVFGILFLFI